MFVAGWRHALRSEWPSIIIITHGEQMLQAVYNHEIQALNDTLWVCELAQKAQYIA